jgi:hypothetical protein
MDADHDGLVWRAVGRNVDRHWQFDTVFKLDVQLR